MCGIAGFHRPDLQTSAAARLRRMVRTLRRRGPDDEGFYTDGPVGLGMRRLSIMDPVGGKQPLFNEDRSIVVVCNGEIYNHPQLRRALEAKGHRYATGSDAETLVHLYEEEGCNMVRSLRGMFGFALYDIRNRRLLLGRDRLGIKPLYYTLTDKGLLFGSEIKALLGSQALTTSLDETALDEYFQFGYIPNPRTIFHEIRKLPPAHSLVLEDGEAKLTRYWSYPRDVRRAMSLGQWIDELTQRFEETVRLHLMSDVPLGAFLSGGIDSSFVVAMMSRMSSQPVKTFTIGFGGNRGGYLDEREIARDVSRAFGTDHHEFEVQPRPDEILDEIVEAFDEPFADDSVIPSYYLCRETRQQVKVALSGLGGDELFGGYERYLGMVLSGTYERLPRLLRSGLIDPLVNRLPELKNGHYTINHMKRFVRAAGFPARERYRRIVSVFPDDERERILPGLDKSRTTACLSPFFENAPGSLLECAIDQDIHTYLPEDILALSDRLSMWHSLELRVPFVDHELVEFCAAVPPHLKIKGRQKKYLLRRAAKAVLPTSVLRHRKQGFAAPMAAWLRSDLKDYVADHLSPAAIKRHGVLEPEAVQQLLKDHWERRELNDRKIFAVLMFQKWADAKKEVVTL